MFKVRKLNSSVCVYIFSALDQVKRKKEKQLNGGEEEEEEKKVIIIK